ncbi:hypothetical protein ABFS82_09G027800 [Erythranthe guttata]
MSNLSAPIVGISISWLPSKPRNQTYKDHQNSSSHLPTHKYKNPRNNHICRAHCFSEIPVSLSSTSSINAPLDAIAAIHNRNCSRIWLWRIWIRRWRRIVMSWSGPVGRF